ncbi:uncharacterized protein LOC129894806 [Solanum dulcamara]|uniref:uncharacterized protein LOC129894806 n=1 Tax=Solanum dulcamara TaxID=45834 RepID=UPI0024861B53|nr:uncharacterized protein LOC129894806 [Solanum dulcamara]
MDNCYLILHHLSSYSLQLTKKENIRSYYIVKLPIFLGIQIEFLKYRQPLGLLLALDMNMHHDFPQDLNMYKKHQVDGDEDASVVEVPIYFMAPEESKVDVLENEKSKDKVAEMIPKNMHYLHIHTFEQRRQNWIIKNKSRLDGSTIDYISFV